MPHPLCLCSPAARELLQPASSARLDPDSVALRSNRRGPVEVVVAAVSPEVIVAAISAVIAVLALAISADVALRQTAIQERLTAIEEARRAEEIAARTRARVTARIGHEQPPQPRYWLIVHNEGPALARGVDVELEERPQTPTVIGLEDLPVDLQPGQERRFLVSVGLNDTQTIRITVRWADEAGNHAEPYTLQIT